MTRDEFLDQAAQLARMHGTNRERFTKLLGGLADRYTGIKAKPRPVAPAPAAKPTPPPPTKKVSFSSD